MPPDGNATEGRAAGPGLMRREITPEKREKGLPETERLFYTAPVECSLSGG